jgi:preprotein translocase subunit Sec63
MYCLSYRWWDTWKEYTEKHHSTLEMELYVDQVRESIAAEPSLTNEIKRCLLGMHEENITNELGSFKNTAQDINAVFNRN